jgi:hypothetical protein
MIKRYFRLSRPDSIVAVCALFSALFSVLESRLNVDTLHWGLMYSNAQDVAQGMIPYRQVFIQYGYLTTLLHALVTMAFGSTVVAIGVATGLFYSCSIVLSYRLWQRAMKPHLACIATVLMFVMHGYIQYPWSNYLSFTFVLVALLFLTAPGARWGRWFGAGIVVSLSLLARQSNFIATLAPFYLLFLYDLVVSPWRLKLACLRKIAIFHVGLVVTVATMLVYFYRVAALSGWYVQNFSSIPLQVAAFGGAKVLVRTLLRNILLAGDRARDLRFIVYSVAFFVALATLIAISFRLSSKRARGRDRALFLFSTMTLFGFLQAFHLYETFRLQNAASPGLGLLVLLVAAFAGRRSLLRKAIVCIPVAFVFLHLGSTVLFAKTSSCYAPWNAKRLATVELKAPKSIPFLKGKLLDREVIAYYETAAATIEANSGSLEYLINYTSDSYLSCLPKKLQRAFICPFDQRRLYAGIFPENFRAIAGYVRDRRAMIVTNSMGDVPPHYTVVANLQKPVEIPWVARAITFAVPTR